MAKETKGTVARYNDDTGNGLIKAEDGSELSFNFTEWEGGGFRPPAEGDSVAFEVAAGAKGPQAKNVRPS